jgi:carboxyl-terminal processing protease
MQIKQYRKFVIVIVIIFLCTTSFFTGVYAAQKKGVTLPASNKEQTVSAKNVDLNLFFSVWNTLKEKSIYYKDNPNEEAIYGAISGLAESLGDPYTTFMGPKETKEFNESLQGSFSGIGAEVGIKDNLLTIIAPLKNSPSEKAGLMAGDKIIKIQGEIAANYSINEAISKIRGEQGTEVELEIYRNGSPETKLIKIMRDIIVIPTISTETKNDVFIITVHNFGEKVSKEFQKSLIDFKNSGKNKIIIDLRGNPGGYLESAVDMASYFLPQGKTIVTEDLPKKSQKQIHTSYGHKLLNQTNPKVVILLDAGSASASEIFAGALRDHNVAKIVGTKSYGKGSVQELIPMPQNTSLKVTIAKWITPNGRVIEKNGIDPDVEVKFVYDEKDTKKDNQMEKALEIINQN